MIITHSSLECFKACRRKYKLRYIQCLVPKQTSDALAFGSAMHEVLEQYFIMLRARSEGEDSKYSPEEEEPFEAFLTSVVNDISEISDTDRAKLLGLTIGYIHSWLSTDWDDYEVIDVEKEFTYSITPYIKFSGKIDGILKRKSDGKYFILEHKTASNVDSSYVDQKKIDAQTMTYALAVQDMLDVEVSGAIHDILIKQKIRLKSGETEAQFKERLISCVTQDNFLRIPIEFTQDELSEFKDELYESCKDLASCNSFYKCTGSCIGRYGACEYLPLCSGSDLQTLAEMYEEKRAHSELSETTVTED